MVESKTGSRLINNREIFIVRPLCPFRAHLSPPVSTLRIENGYIPSASSALFVCVHDRFLSLERGIVKRSVSFLAINENGEINRGFQNIGE